MVMLDNDLLTKNYIFYHLVGCFGVPDEYERSLTGEQHWISANMALKYHILHLHVGNLSTASKKEEGLCMLMEHYQV